jgi:branched-chain amino acid transport system permease protein
MMFGNSKRDFVWLLVIIAVLALLPFVLGEYYAYLIRLIGIYAIAALGLNIFMGYCGQINFGSAAFFCIGAYGSTVLQVHLGWHYFLAFPAALALNFVVAWGVSFPLLRLRGHAMAIGTLSLAMAIYLIADRFPTLTGGSDGIMVPSTEIFGRTMGEMFYYYLILAFVAASYLVCNFLTRSPIGRGLKAVRGDEVAAEALGSNVNHYKTVAWIVSGMLGGVAGGLYSQQAGFLSPSTFGLQCNITLLLMIIVGGMASNVGSVAGAVIMTLLSYFLVTIEEYIVLVYGLILFVVLRFMPGGFVSLVPKILNARTRKEEVSVEPSQESWGGNILNSTKDGQ